METGKTGRKLVIILTLMASEYEVCLCVLLVTCENGWKAAMQSTK
jgi:hypothetical protein